MNKPILELDNVSLSFAPAHKVLHNLSMSLEKGSFTALLGASGCGKSTLLHLIAGLIQPTGGTITRHLQTDHIGFVFQDPVLMDWTTVYHNVALPLKLQKQTQKQAGRKAENKAQNKTQNKASDKASMEAQIMASLTQVGLETRANALPRELSGGMKMRVSLARALVTQPDLLLMDEPFAALDELNRAKMEDDLYHIWQTTGCTVLFVTHNVMESAYLASQVMIMKNGHIAQTIEINNAPRGEAYRTNVDFLKTCQEISTAL
ncbi:MAG: ABC transporter ATP-binding protein, partial [Alphaproteobacteria bacterium]|nr:ABC transporter ATP-binding protein [Alphaproteobacteria bacterium]